MRYMYSIGESVLFGCDEHFSLHMSIITQDGDSALMMAVRKVRTEVVSLLLKANINQVES